MTVTQSLFLSLSSKWPFSFSLLTLLSLTLDKGSSSSNLMQAALIFHTGCLSCLLVQFGVKRLQRGHNRSCFQAVLLRFQLLARYAFSHTPACMLCLLSGLCEKLSQEAKKPTNGLLSAGWHPESVRLIMFSFFF